MIQSGLAPGIRGNAMEPHRTEKRKKPPAAARIFIALIVFMIVIVGVLQVGLPDSLTPAFLK